MAAELYPYVINRARVMVFVDGENLAIRYGAMLASLGTVKQERTQYMPSVAVWTPLLSPSSGSLPGGPGIIRKYYYTSIQGDDLAIEKAQDWIKDIGFEAPRVFKKSKGKGSKQVDISLATDMLSLAADKHYDIAVLVAGDEDYVPLVRAVKREGPRVHIWFLSDGLSPKLRREADYFACIDEFLF